MNTKIQDILPLIEMPSRYLGTEINSVRKDHDKILLRFALAFPDLYEIGTSHFGIQILYHILNTHCNIAAERVYAPAADMEEQLRLSGIPISSLESGTSLKNFDIIGFSLLYELNYTNILTILDLAGIPFYASQRDESFPFIIAGGPCTCNPEPVADFFDAVVVGDGEKVIMEMAEAWMEWKKEHKGNKEILLKKWAGIEGVYIPCFFKPEFDESGIQTLVPYFPEYTKITRTIIPDLNLSPFPDSPVIPFGRPIHDRLRIELARGCTRGCRFCQAGMIYRPVRERSQENLVKLVESAIKSTGYEDISLLSLSTGDYSCIASIMKQLIDRCIKDNIAISLPSLRAGTLTPELMELIKKIRKTGFTIAPEAASQRLRNVINKNIVEQDIIDTVQDAFKAGWQVIKLYFMIGLPTETHEDIQSIVELVKNLKKIKPFKGKAQINVSAGTFIPKPHTPFQWLPQISLEQSKEKIYWLKNELNIPGVKFKWQNPEVSLLEGIWSRGNRKLSNLLVSAYKKGCRFDGWSDQFRYDLWQETFEQAQIDIKSCILKPLDMEKPLPWDHIDMGLTKKFLKNEWEKAVQEKITQDCRNKDCNNCGVCDFDTIKPMICKEAFKENCSENNKPAPETKTPKNDNFITIEVLYSKQGPAKYFGHLEMVSIFFRAIRRAGIALKYSQGFHPMPRISFNDPLSIGIESLNESFYMAVPDDLNIKIKNIKDQINKQLPKGLAIHKCQLAPPKSARHKFESNTYQITIKSGIFDEKALHGFEQSQECFLTKTNKKGQIKKINIKETILKLELLSSQQVEIIINNAPGKRIKPVEALKTIFNLSDQIIKQASIIKL
ncbi:Radical SAM domain-containing protein, DUF2344 [Desulfonema limicola]|uniref:Radical SAM domain-containing protein, DUF2344 n=1 Tax=Desulfonema limicola TaxID=45656 RepID=A0A975B3J4_9BACT|nr:TIGR03960 family B12-binding radical SAM protein [Desulfonema limicola]QTA78137.1 Radical SAM domain-containing protein, DUF2344 [Desulfonema limicola]